MKEKPFEERGWVNLTELSEYLGFSVGHTRQRITTLPGFPQPANFNASAPTNAHRRWNAVEVARWAQTQARSNAA